MERVSGPQETEGDARGVPLDAMSEALYNPDDPAFLISRTLDENLSEQERRRVDDALAESEALRIEERQLRAVDRLVKSWSSRTAQIDWDVHAALICDLAADENGADALRAVDHLLKRWGERSVAFDEQRFAEAVMERVRRDASGDIVRGAEAGRTSRRGWIIRLRAPLAAAAVVVFSLTTAFWFASGGSNLEPVCEVVVGPRLAMAAPSPADGLVSRAVVSFAREVPVGPASSGGPTFQSVAERDRVSVPRSSGISFTAIGAVSLFIGVGEMPP